MIFIYNKSRATDLTIKFIDGELLLCGKVDGVSFGHHLFDVDEATEAYRLLNDKYGEGVVLEKNPCVQYVNTKIGFCATDYSVEGKPVELLNHQPTPEERDAILPRNIVFVITDKGVKATTHKNNISPHVPYQVYTEFDLSFTRIAPKYNKWKVLKYPIVINICGDGINEKVLLSSKEKRNKFGKKYSANIISVEEMTEEEIQKRAERYNNSSKRKNTGKVYFANK